jgi:hypothetical protein
VLYSGAVLGSDEGFVSNSWTIDVVSAVVAELEDVDEGYLSNVASY